MQDRDAAKCLWSEGTGNEAYNSLPIPTDLGAAGASYKWRQTLTHVDIFVPLPLGTTAKQVTVDLTPSSIRVIVQERTVLSGSLFRAIKCDESTWFMQVTMPGRAGAAVMLLRGRCGLLAARRPCCMLRSGGWAGWTTAVVQASDDASWT